MAETEQTPEAQSPAEQEEAAGAQAPAEEQPQRPAAAARPRPGQPAGPPIGEREPPKPSAEALSTTLKEVWEGIPYDQKFNYGDLEVAIQPGDLLEACRRCKSDPRLSMDYLMCISGTDYESYFEVVYHLYSYRDHRRLMIRTKLDYEHPSVSSVTPLWKGADWHERETAEMLGIDFPGHPNLVPLLLEEGIDERPLRKSHPLVPIFADRPGVVTRPHDNGA